MSSDSWFINCLYCWLYSSYILHKKLNKILQEPDCPFVSFWNLNSFYFIFSHSFSFVVPISIIGCHSLSLVITRCHSLLLIDIRFHSIYHSLSFVVPRCTTRYHSLYHSFWFVVTRCTTPCHSMNHSSVFLYTIEKLLMEWHTVYQLPWEYWSNTDIELDVYVFSWSFAGPKSYSLPRTEISSMVSLTPKFSIRCYFLKYFASTDFLKEKRLLCRSNHLKVFLKNGCSE